MQRRQFIQIAGAGAIATTLAGCASTKIDAKGAKVLVIGGGYGGAAWRQHRGACRSQGW